MNTCTTTPISERAIPIASWSPEPVTITPQADETIVVPFDDQLDLSSGFFKVELVEVVP